MGSVGVDLEITTEGQGRGMTNGVAKLYGRLTAKERATALLALIARFPSTSA